MDAPLAPGHIIDGKYLVEATLGSGGMGVVVRARHLELEQPVAIKVLRSDAGEVWQRRFLREARAASRIPSQHVVKVFDVGWVNKRLPYMVMELLEGRDLADVVYNDGPLLVDDAVQYVMQACEALAAAHARGIVHRDIKPANLFLAMNEDGSNALKLLDFGISKEALAASSKPETLTQTDAVLGSPLFMSPEQLACSRDVDERADIWSLGVTLFELLTGEQCFPGESVAELYSAILRDEPRGVCELSPEVPEALAEVVSRCLKKDPAERYASVLELAEALEPFAPSGASRTLERVRELSKPPLDAEPFFSTLDDDDLLDATPEPPTYSELPPPSSQAPPRSEPPTLYMDRGLLEQLTEDELTPGPSVRPTTTSMRPEVEPDPRRRWPLGVALAAGVVLGMVLAMSVALEKRAAVLLASPPRVLVTTAAVAAEPEPTASATSALASPFADSVLIESVDRERLQRALDEAQTELDAGRHAAAAKRAEAVLRELRDRGVRPGKAVSSLGAQSQLVVGRVEALRLHAMLSQPNTRDEAEALDANLDRQLAQARTYYDAVRLWGVRSLFRCAVTEAAQLDLAAGRLFAATAASVSPRQRKWYVDRARKHLRHARTGFRHAMGIMAETSLCMAGGRDGVRDTQSALEQLTTLVDEDEPAKRPAKRARRRPQKLPRRR